MTVNTAYNPFPQPLSINGDVLPGCKWYFYENGTTTLKDVYQDHDKTSTHTNPVVADSQGRFPDIHLDGVYSIRFATSADVWITGTQMDDYNKGFDTVDQSATGGSSLTGFEYDESNSSGLSFKVGDGIVENLDGTASTVTTSSLTLDASATNYVFLQLWNNTVVASTTAGGSNTSPIYEVTTDSSSATLITDKRADAFKRRDNPASYLNGLAITSNGSDSDHDIDISAGNVRSSDDTTDGELSSGITKQIDATWADGNNTGGLAASVTLASGTTYYVHALINPDGSVNAGFDSSSTAVNLLADSAVSTAGYTKYRLLGQVNTNSGDTNLDTSTIQLASDDRINEILKGNYGQQVELKALKTGLNPWDLISEVDLSTLGSGNCQFTGLSGYDIYKLQFNGVSGAATHNLFVQWGTTTTYGSGYSDTGFLGSAASIQISSAAAAARLYSGEITFIALNDSTTRTVIKGFCVHDAGAAATFADGTGTNSTRDNNDIISLQVSAGNFDAGTARLYGLTSR